MHLLRLWLICWYSNYIVLFLYQAFLQSTNFCPLLQPGKTRRRIDSADPYERQQEAAETRVRQQLENVQVLPSLCSKGVYAKYTKVMGKGASNLPSPCNNLNLCRVRKNLPHVLTTPCNHSMPPYNCQSLDASTHLGTLVFIDFVVLCVCTIHASDAFH